MSADEATGVGRGSGERPVTYCLVPAELAPKLHDLLDAHFRDDPDVEVVVERRGRERRSGKDRRSGEGAAPEAERRRIHSKTGRRVGERRTPATEAEPPGPLPRRARRYAGELRFVECLEPSGDEAEDLDTTRLVTRFQAGDRDAFGTLYTRYFHRVYTYMRIAVRSPEDAEDATQQVFTKAFEALDRYELRGRRFQAWLFTIVRNVALTELRKQGRIEIVDPEVIERHLEAGEVDEGIEGIGWIADRDLVLFVERLTLPQRQVLVLRYLLDLAFPDIARLLDRSPEDVRILHHRALHFLEQRLAAVGRRPTGRGRARIRSPLRQAPVLRARRHALTEPR